MKPTPRCRLAGIVSVSLLLLASVASAQIGKRFPSEKKVVTDPVTGVPLTFLTSTPHGDSKIYQTHHQWTSDGKWVIFRSSRAGHEAMAVNEETGVMVQVTEGGYTGMLCLADHSMSLYFLRTSQALPGPAIAPDSAPASGVDSRGRRPTGPAQIIKVDLGKLFADSEADKLKAATEYEHVCGTIPMEWGAGGDMALDCTENYAYFRVGREESVKHLAADTKAEATYGPRNMGAGPAGLGKMDLKTGEVGFIVAVPFQIGHVQTNPWMPGEIVFCWETGGKAPQRTWTVMADGTGLRPLFPEAPFDWITHEAVITKDEVAIAIIAHQKVGTKNDWGIAGTAEHPSGLAIVNLRTREMRIIGQVPVGNPGRSDWHVNGSPDGRWGVFDDFLYRLWLVDRHSGETIMLADLGHMTTAADHIHPTFNAASNKIEVQSAMLSADGDKRSLNIVVVPVPESWLKRTYSDKIQ